VLELNSKLAPLSPLDYTMLLLREGVVPFVEQHVVVISDAGTIRLLDVVVCDEFLLCTGLCFVVPKTGPSSSAFGRRLCRAHDSGGVDNIVSGGLEYALPDPFLSHHGPAEQLEQVQVSCCGFVWMSRICFCRLPSPTLARQAQQHTGVMSGVAEAERSCFPELDVDLGI
jgi:hypothetical protein